MSHSLLIGFASIIFFGMAAQWISWRFKLPSILLLLLFGFAAGPWLNIVRPDEFFGDMLFPFVSLSVAVILFEGGLNLKLSELKAVGGVVRNLISIGVVVTWVLSIFCAYYFAGLDLNLSILFGAILVVTGPTVIMPILRYVRPTGQVNSILKWEGIVNDPIGALLAILVFEGIIAVGFREATLEVAFGLLKTILLSSSIGLIGAYFIVLMLRYKLMPDFLENLISLATVVSIFAASNLVQAESGLFATTIMGVFLANQKSVTVKHIVEFKENLRTLLISILFIVLAARLNISDLKMLSFGSFLFVAMLILIVRPAAIYLSTIGSSINWKEKLYLAFMAPRGVVAAAVTSVFALELVKEGYKTGEQLVPLMFLVIIVTIAVYGLSAVPLAKWLGIANTNPQGCLIIGAHPLGRAIGSALKEKGIKVLMVDSNYNNIRAAKMADLPAFNGSILSDYILDEIDLNGIGKLLAITPNKEVNSLAALHFSKIFGSSEVYQLSVEEDEENKGKKVSQDLRGQILFGTEYTYYALLNRFNSDQQIKSSKITEKFNYDAFLKKYKGDQIIPFFIIDEDNELIVYTAEDQPKPKEGQTIIGLFKEQEIQNEVGIKS